MTEGVIWKQLLMFAVPLLLGNLFQQLYNTVDSVVVGNYIGGNALAAVGASNPIINLLVGLFMGIATGAGVVIARFFGAQDKENAQKAVHTALAISLLSGLVLMVAGALLSPVILGLVNTPPEVMDGAVTYMRIYFLGVLAMMFYNMGAGILRAVGDSRTPLYFLIVASVVNIVLDLLFVVKVGMGIAGVAWATLIAQSISAVLILIRLLTTKEIYRVEFKRFRIDVPCLKEIIRIGLPGGIQNAVVSFSNVIVQANINSFGAAAMAGCSAYSKIDGFALMPVMSFSMAITTFTSQNMGAKNYDRVKAGAKTCTIMSMALSGAMAVILLLFSNNILRIFSSDQTILQYANLMMRFLAPGYIFLAIAHSLCGVVRGAGVATVPMIVLVGNMCVLRMIWIAAMMPLFNNIIIVFLGYTLTWLTSALCMIWYYKKRNWLHRDTL